MGTAADLAALNSRLAVPDSIPRDAELARTIPGSRLVVYEGTGHFVLWERPEWVARDLVASVTAGA